MSVDKLVDSTQLDSDLTSVANAIRTKGGTSAQMAFPNGFVAAVDAIPIPETYYVVPYNGRIYPKKLNQTLTGFSIYKYSYTWRGCEYLEELNIVGLTDIAGGANSDPFSDCPNLKKAILPSLTQSNSFAFRNDTALEEVQLGSIGNAVTSLSSYFFASCSQSGLTVTIYVNDNATLPLANSPFGATNATIIYRSATTGEVITV